MTQPNPKRDAAVAKIAANVRSALAWRNISGAAAGPAIGIKQQAMSRRMTGEVPFDVGDLVLIADLVGISPGHLVAGEPWVPEEVAGTPI